MACDFCLDFFPRRIPVLTEAKMIIKILAIFLSIVIMEFLCLGVFLCCFRAVLDMWSSENRSMR